jgi:hypothetical protein
LPVNYLSSEWIYAQNQTVLLTGKEDKGQSNTYSLWWNMLSREYLNLQSTYTLYTSLNQSLATSGTVESNSQINSLAQDYSLSYNPIPILTITPGFRQENYRNDTTGTALLETQMQQHRCSAILEPYRWVNFRADYAHKITTRLSDHTDRHKTNTGFTTTFKPFDWGTIIHSLEEEDNGGEVSASGALVETNYRKNLNTFTLNFNIPQNHPLLEGVIVNLTYKQVNFRNLLAGREGDNFDASSLTFEGILNF